MFDAAARKLIDPPLNAAGRVLAARGVGADAVTLAGLACGLCAALAVAFGAPLAGLALIGLNRLADGLDGAVARAGRTTPFGGFLDLSADFLVYGAVPLGFAWAAPEANALAAAFLLFGFLANGAAFLAFAVLAAERGVATEAQGRKSLYYVAGLAEGGETILFFVLFCLFPASFPVLAAGFGALCLASAAGRILLAARMFRAA